jgi:hypothetical protein
VTTAQATSHGRRFELFATLLLALATIATAWSAYQSREWTGEQAQGYSKATATRIAVNRTSSVANRQVQVDVATFIQWVNAHQEHRDGLAAFYRARFRNEFKPAFAAWLATNPLLSFVLGPHRDRTTLHISHASVGSEPPPVFEKLVGVRTSSNPHRLARRLSDSSR